MLAALLLAGPSAACDSRDGTPAPAAAPPTTAAAPPVGGDDQPGVRDVVRVALTEKQKKEIVKACSDAQEITADDKCREALPYKLAPETIAPGGETCGEHDYCMILDRVSGQIVVAAKDAEVLRLPAPEPVIDGIASEPPSPAPPSPSDSSAPGSAEPTGQPEPTDEPQPTDEPEPGAPTADAT
ncbi:hypothetical protein Ade02nite_96480 [Paractinoplanes deccanensis]|uniref:Uncharacterized protein n=1 Tax=Paractinoplanes deccanensis TaxID=113561 RepID=A0ABQ3YM29_9ACTN|nr:hypothetical protein Ade02nite_96480 [Actinoplanes deccanensis]